MPTTTIQQDIEVLKQLKVTDWEKNFISSISEGLGKYGRLTDKQQVAFDKIAEKYLDENGSPKIPSQVTKTKTWTASTPSSGEKKPSEIPPTWYLKKAIEKLSGELKKDAEDLLAKLAPREAAAREVKSQIETQFNTEPSKVGAPEIMFDEPIPF